MRLLAWLGPQTIYYYCNSEHLEGPRILLGPLHDDVGPSRANEAFG